MGDLYGFLYNVFMGGWFKGKRTQVLGYATLLGTVAYAFVQWAVGDMNLQQVFAMLKDNWPALAAGWGMIFVGDKIDAVKEVAVKAESNAAVASLKASMLVGKKDG